MMSPVIDRRAFRDLSYGLYIVTSRDSATDRINGQVVNTVIQVTSEPPRVAVIINKQNLTHEFISASKVFGVMVLAESTPLSFFGPFGFRSGRDFDKFAEVQYQRGSTGCPLLIEHTLSVLEVSVSEQVDMGTHTIFVGPVAASQVLREGTPLTYHYYHTVLRGKSSKNAPTYIEGA